MGKKEVHQKLIDKSKAAKSLNFLHSPSKPTLTQLSEKSQGTRGWGQHSGGQLPPFPPGYPDLLNESVREPPWGVPPAGASGATRPLVLVRQAVKTGGHD